ncbi:hypothetical protein [Brachybacterium sp. UNK5269]|uniref:hypothetical protein n=1 Tax=Brachybacterium sp. UNK5269 TaxID=3408576 RepID=UPI003BB0A282
MTMGDEAQPKRPRNRRRTYAKRIELRLTETQLDLVERARSTATEAAGRNVTLSEVVRSSVEDGCKAIIKAMRGTPAPAGVDGERLAESFTALTEELQGIRGALRPIGHNVNAMARVAHTTGIADGDLAEVKQQLSDIDARLVVAATAALNLSEGDTDG